MTDRYILDDEGEPQLCEDLIEWAMWRETADCTVLLTRIGEVKVSTVFLGLDYRHFGDGPPLLWETMVFEGRFDMFLWRYTNKLDAMRGHIRSVALVELSNTAPRKLKKALRKGASSSFYNLRAREQRRVTRALTRAMERMDAH